MRLVNFIKSKSDKYIKSELNINIFFSFLLKGFSILISFLSVPLTLNYLNKEEYGLWILILSITSWIYTFDVGIGNGLKNKIAEYLVTKKYKKVREIILTSYFSIFFISTFIFLFNYFILRHLNLNNLLKVDFLDNKELLFLVILNIGFVCLNFLFLLCDNIFIGSQKTYLSSINKVLIQLINLLFLLILYLLNKKSIFYLSIFNGISVSISCLIMSFYYFKKNRNLIPRLKDFSFSNLRSILNIGGKIFIIQIASLIIFSTDNLIITNFLGPDKVAEYSIVNKFFSVPMILLGLICTPIWSQATKQYYIKNFLWFKKILKNLNILFGIIVVGMIFMIVCGQKIIYIWTTNKINPNFSLIVITAISVLLTCYSNIYSTILFGINEMTFLMYLAIFQAILNIILSYSFIKYLNLGVNGVILATCFCMFTNIITLPNILKRKLKKIRESAYD